MNALRKFLRDSSGVASLEFILWMMVLVPGLFSTVDLGAFVFQRMQVENAAQMAVQAAWQNCEDPTAAAGCPNMESAIATALTKTSLGAAVTEDSSKRAQGYYCPDTAKNELASNANSTCDADTQAGYYINLTATYDFKPIIGGVISAGSLLPTKITYPAWARLK